MRTIINLFKLFSTCIILLLAVFQAFPEKPIMPYSKNPVYWEYKNKPVVLLGGSEHDFQWENENTTLKQHLNLLKKCGGNYIRCTLSSRKSTQEGLKWDILPYPYEKINGKYDLTRWNEIYWNRLYQFLHETHKRDIIVQLSLFDRWNESGNSERDNNGWYHSPYNPNNNINYSWNDSPLLVKGQTKFYNEFHYAAVKNDSLLLSFQQNFIKKVIDLVIDNGFGNVLFQVDNDSGIGDESLEPDPYWANFVRDYGKMKDEKFPVFVCIQRRFHWPSPYITDVFQDWENPEIKETILNPAFDYCDISQNNGNTGQIHYDNALWFRSKVYEFGVRPINNIKCFYLNWPTGADFHTARSAPSDAEALSKPWRLIFAGAAGIHFPDSKQWKPGDIKEGFGLTPEGQFYLKGMRKFLGAVNIFKMQPDNELLKGRTDNEAYCLVQTGKQYAVFFTGEGDNTVEINLETTSKRIELKWLNLSDNRWYHSKPAITNNQISLSPPTRENLWIAVLTKK